MKKILIIEDDETTALVLAEYLIDNGFRVDTATCGMQAIEEFQNRSFDVLLVDFTLKDMTGAEVVERFREKNSRQKVIFLSAFDLEKKVTRTTRTHLIEKPCRPRQILAAVNHIIRV
ncbi:MAG: response regulator [bacterium]